MKIPTAIIFLPFLVLVFSCEHTGEPEWQTPGTWVFSRAADSTRFYHAIQFVDAGNGWIVGDSGTILHTSNGGTSWETQQSGTTASLWSVRFRGIHNGWACGRNTIGMTRDGGFSWAWQYPAGDSLRGFLCLFFADELSGWIGDNMGGILHTQDGGQTWIEQATGTNFAIGAMQFLDASEGWALSVGGSVLHTLDGGAHWASTDLRGLDCGSAHIGMPRDIFFSDQSTGWIATDMSMSSTMDPLAAMPYTADAGSTCGCLPTPNAQVNAIWFANRSLGWEADGRGIMPTTDGGSNWEYECETPTYHMIDLSMVDASHGWALTFRGEVYTYVRP